MRFLIRRASKNSIHVYSRCLILYSVVLSGSQAMMHHWFMKAYSLDPTEKKMVAAVLERGMPAGEKFV